MNTIQQFSDIVSHFQIDTHASTCTVLSSGHIHDTYLYVSASGRYILQRINHLVFRQPETVMDNIQKVTDWQLAYFEQHHLDAAVPHLIRTHEGLSFYADSHKNYWRMFSYIPDTVSYEKIQNPVQAYEAAKAFGFFVKTLHHMPATSLQETIPNFHHALLRTHAFEQALQKGLPERIQIAAPEIAFFRSRRYLAEQIGLLLEHKIIPIRIVHNDTKISNVLMDARTGKGICAIDLDTVMPGTLLYDFGDMMRTFLSPADEDEMDLTRIECRMDIFQALVQGYLEEVKDWILPAEKDNLVFSGKLMTYIMGIRFLTDYLQGDTYYKIHRPTHNLDRCRTQMRLLELLEAHETPMKQFVESSH